MEIIRDGTVKTRKDHRCHGCRKVIPAGSTVYSQTDAEDTIYTIYMCGECRKWCGNCKECFEMDGADEGYVADCRKERPGRG